MHDIDVPSDAPEGGEKSEWNLIFDAWALSWRKSPWSGTVRNCDWDATSRAAMSEIVDRPTACVRVVWTMTADGVRRVKGYIVAEPSRRIIHWLFVKRDFRGQGVARALMKHVMEDDDKRSKWIYTHRTYACARLFRGMTHDKSYACRKD